MSSRGLNARRCICGVTATCRKLLVCGVFLLLLFHARTSAKAAGGKRQRRATAPSGAEPCKSAKSAAQLIKRARKLRSGDPEAALACLEVGAHRFAQSGELWEEHGALLEDMGKPHDALEMFERAIALSPSLGLAALRLGNIYASHQDDARAIELFQKASKARPDSPVPYNNIGLAHMRNGRVKEAHEIFRRGLDSTPEGAFGRSMILNNVGLLLKEQGDVESAAQYFQQALELEASVEAASNLSALLIQAGNYEQAWAVCSAMIAGKPGSLNAQLAEIGVVSLTLLDRMQEAAQLMHQAGESGVDASALLGAAMDRLAAQGQPMAALDLLAFGFGEHSPAQIGARQFVRAGQLLTEAHQIDEQRHALRSYVTCLRLVSDTSASGADVGEQQTVGEAEREREATGRELTRVMGPPAIQALRGLAMLLYQATRFADAERCFRRIVAFDSNHPRWRLDSVTVAEAYNGLGAAIEMSHTRLDEAVAHYAKARAAKPDFFVPFFSQVHLLGRICDWREWEQHFELARELIDQGVSGGIGPIFALAYPLSHDQLCTVTRNRAADVQQRAAASRAQAPLEWWYSGLWLPSQGPSAPSHLEKLAVAVVSADLNARPVGQLVQGIFGRLDKDRFESLCFSLGVYDGSPAAQRVAETCTEFQLVKALDSRLLADMINAAQAHILIDLNGYTDGGRPELLALRPAPVTVAYLGYPHTTALQGVDYILSDRIVTPPEHYLTRDLSCFTEHVAVMPHTYMVSHHKISHAAAIAGDFSEADARLRQLPHTDQQVVLANFNHLQKLGPRTFQLWIAILQRASNSTLWLLRFPGEAEAHLKREAAAAGIDPRRVLLTDKFADTEHLRVKRAASMLLDTLEYNAHVSGLDALWAGLPLVTLAGDNMARRCGASFLQSMGLGWLLARTPAEYVQVARVLAQGPTRGAYQGRATLRRVRAAVEAARETSALFDHDLWVEELQRMLQLMWETAHATGSADTRKGTPRPLHLVLAGHTGWGLSQRSHQ